MAVLDLITHLFPAAGGAVTLDLARGQGHGHGHSFISRHFWLVGLGLGVACFLAAAVKPANFAGHYVSYRVSVFVWSGLGALMLTIAVYFGATHGW